jgi:hypothetical protein
MNYIRQNLVCECLKFRTAAYVSTPYKSDARPMSRDVDGLRDDQWERLRDLILGGRAGQRGPRCDNQRFVDALLWMARSGARWRDLPARFGEPQSQSQQSRPRVIGAP